MKSGYKVHWTPNALEELSETIKYLQENFTNKEISRLALEIEEIIQLISQNPELFKTFETKNIHQVVILKYNTMYYRVNNDEIEILSFFPNRQNPEKRNI